MSKSNLKLILLVDKLFFSLLKIWLLDFDNHCKQLIFKTRLCNNEVDDGTLSSGLWLVVRVNQLGLQVQLERVGNLNILRSKSNCVVLTLLDKLSGEKWIKNGIDILTNSFDHEHLTI